MNFSLVYKELGASWMVQDWVDFGYNLRFSSFSPTNINTPNNRSALEQLTFLKAEIDQWLKLSILERVDEPPYLDIFLAEKENIREFICWVYVYKITISWQKRRA